MKWDFLFITSVKKKFCNTVILFQYFNVPQNESRPRRVYIYYFLSLWLHLHFFDSKCKNNSPFLLWFFSKLNSEFVWNKFNWQQKNVISYQTRILPDGLHTKRCFSYNVTFLCRNGAGICEQRFAFYFLANIRSSWTHKSGYRCGVTFSSNVKPGIHLCCLEILSFFQKWIKEELWFSLYEHAYCSSGHHPIFNPNAFIQNGNNFFLPR